MIEAYSSTKNCTACGVAKPLDQFHVDKSKKSGRKAKCASCCNSMRTPRDHSLYYWKNRERVLKRVAEYASKNKSKDAARSASRYAAKKIRKVNLTERDKFAIKSIYAFSKWFSDKTGIKHQVDHIVPLRGDIASGLHVPWNLRIIPASMNSSKGNRVDLRISHPAFLKG